MSAWPICRRTAESTFAWSPPVPRRIPPRIGRTGSLKDKGSRREVHYAEGEISLEEIIGTILAKGARNWPPVNPVRPDFWPDRLLGFPEVRLTSSGGSLRIPISPKSIYWVSSGDSGTIGAGSVRETARKWQRYPDPGGVDYGLAVTGIAGPDGGLLKKPVGTVSVRRLGSDGRLPALSVGTRS